MFAFDKYLSHRALLHWKTISFLLMPLPLVSFVYGYFLPESPIYIKVKGFQFLEFLMPIKANSLTSKTNQWTWRLRINHWCLELEKFRAHGGTF